MLIMDKNDKSTALVKIFSVKAGLCHLFSSFASSHLPYLDTVLYKKLLYSLTQHGGEQPRLPGWLDDFDKTPQKLACTLRVCTYL